MKNQDMMIVYPDYEEPINVLKVFFNAQKIKFEPSNESHTPLSLAKKIEKAWQDYKKGRDKVYSSEQLNSIWK